MTLSEDTFEYLKPSEAQRSEMDGLRREFHRFASMLDYNLPNGADKVYLLRKLREVAMWTNIAITRHSDGSPRTDDDVGDA